MLDALIGALCSWLRSVLDSDDDDQLQRQEMKGGILPSEHGWEHRPLGYRDVRPCLVLGDRTAPVGSAGRDDCPRVRLTTGEGQ